MTRTLCPIELRRLYYEGRVIPFVGAGTSMSVTWQQDNVLRRGLSWQELVEHASKLLDIDANLLRMRGTDLQILEYFNIKENGFSKLTNWLHFNMQPRDSDLQESPIHAALVALDECSLFYTTNFDDFLERSLRLRGREVSVITSEHDMSQKFRGTRVVKFHGDFNSPGRMVLSESHYERRMALEEPLDLKLRSDALGQAILFIGYSFRDPNIAYLFRVIQEKLGDLPKSFAGKRAYIIVANPSDFEIQLFQARNIEVIRTEGEDKASGVAQVLREMAS